MLSATLTKTSIVPTAWAKEDRGVGMHGIPFDAPSDGGALVLPHPYGGQAAYGISDKASIIGCMMTILHRPPRNEVPWFRVPISLYRG